MASKSPARAKKKVSPEKTLENGGSCGALPENGLLTSISFSASDFTSNFSDYLRSIYTEGVKFKFSFRDFATCASHEVKSSVYTLINEMLKHFEHVQLYRSIYKHLHENVVKTVGLRKTLQDTINEISQLVEKKIAENKDWSVIIMFGAFIVEIFKVSALPMATVENWIVRLLPRVESGSMDAEIALLLIMKRASSDEKFTCTKLWKRYMAIARKIAKTIEKSDSEQREENAEAAHSQHDSESPTASSADKLVSPQDDMQHEETLAQLATNSVICKHFQASLDGAVKFDNSNFEFITPDELEVCARMMIDKAVSHPKAIRHLTIVVYHYQDILFILRQFVRAVVQECLRELENFEKENFKSMSSWHYMNYAWFFGELFMLDKCIFETNDMINWIETLLKAENEFSIEALIVTMRLCGRKLKIDDNINFDQYLSLMKSSAKSNQQRKVIEELELQVNDDEKSGAVLDLLTWSTVQRKPATDCEKIIMDFRSYLRLLNRDDSDARFDFNALLERDYGSRRLEARFMAKKMLEKVTNALAYAKFLKELYTVSFAFGDFIKKLKFNLSLRICNVKMDLWKLTKELSEGTAVSALENSSDLISLKHIGIFVAHLTNMFVIDKGTLYEYINTIKAFDPVQNPPIFTAYLEVFDVAFMGMQIHDRKNFDYNTVRISRWYTAQPALQARIEKITEKYKTLEIPKSLVDVIFKAKKGQISYNFKVTELDEAENAQEFAKIFFLNAISNRLTCKNFAKAVKEFFNASSSFRKAVISHCQEYYKRFFSATSGPVSESDEDDALGTVLLIAEMLVNKVLCEKTGKTIVSNLQKAAEKHSFAREALRALVEITEEELERGELKSQVKELAGRLRSIEQPLNQVEVYRVVGNKPNEPQITPKSARIDSSNIFDKATNLRIKNRFQKIAGRRREIPSLPPSNDPFYDYANALFQLRLSTIITEVAVKLAPLKDLSDAKSLEKYVVITKDYIYRNPAHTCQIVHLITQLTLVKNGTENAIEILDKVRDGIAADICECREVFKAPTFMRCINPIFTESKRRAVCETLLSRIHSEADITETFVLMNILFIRPAGADEARKRRETLLGPLNGLLAFKYPPAAEEKLRELIKLVESQDNVAESVQMGYLIEVTHLIGERREVVVEKVESEEDEDEGEKKVWVEIKTLDDIKRLRDGKSLPSTSKPEEPQKMKMKTVEKPKSSSKKERVYPIALTPIWKQSKAIEPAAKPDTTSSAPASVPQNNNAETPPPMPKKYQAIAIESAEFRRKFNLESLKSAADDDTASRFKEILSILTPKNANSLGRTVNQNVIPQEQVVSKYAYLMKEFLYSNPSMGGSLKKFAIKMRAKSRMKNKLKEFVEFDVYEACSNGKLVGSSFIEAIKNYFNKNFIFLLWRNILEYISQGNTRALVTLVMFMNGSERMMNTKKKRKYLNEFLAVLNAQLEKNSGYEGLKRVIKSLEALKGEKTTATDDESMSEDEPEEAAPRIKNYRTVGMKFTQKLVEPRPTTKRRPRKLISNPFRGKANASEEHDEKANDELFAGLNLGELKQHIYPDRNGVTYEVDFSNQEKAEWFAREYAKEFDERKRATMFDGSKVDSQYRPVPQEELVPAWRRSMPSYFAAFDVFDTALRFLLPQNVDEIARKLKPTLLKTDEDLNFYGRVIVNCGYSKPENAPLIIQLIHLLKDTPGFSIKKLKAGIEQCFQFDLIGVIERRKDHFVDSTESFCKFFIGMYNSLHDSFIFKQWRLLMDCSRSGDKMTLKLLVTLMDGHEHILFNTKARKIFVSQFIIVLEGQVCDSNPEEVKPMLDRVLKALKNPQSISGKGKGSKDDDDDDDDDDDENAENAENGVVAAGEFDAISLEELKAIISNFPADTLKRLEAAAKGVVILSREEMFELAQHCFNIMLKGDEIILNSSMCRVAFDNVRNGKSPVSFSDALTKVALENFDKLFKDYKSMRVANKTISMECVENIVKSNSRNRKISLLVGHLFNQGIISLTEIVKLIERMWTVSQLDLFELTTTLTLLDVTSTKILIAIREGKAAGSANPEFLENCKTLVKMYTGLYEVSKSDISHIILYDIAPISLQVREILKVLELIHREIMSKPPQEGNSAKAPQEPEANPYQFIPPMQAFLSILEELTDENMATSVRELLKINSNNKEDFDTIVDLFTEKMWLDRERSSLMIKLLKYAKAKSDRSNEPSKLMSYFPERLKINFTAKAMAAIVITEGDTCSRIVDTVCNLYHSNLLDLDFVSQCLILFSTRRDKCGENTFSLLLLTGAAFKLEEPEELHKYTKYYRTYYENNRDKGSDGAIAKSLMELYQNCWVPSRLLKTDIFDAFLNDDVSMSTLRLQKVEKGIQAEAFVQAIWRNLMKSPSRAVELADAVFDVSALFSENFTAILSDFMEKRRRTFLEISKDSYNGKIHERLKFFIIFVLELFKLEILTEDLDKWIHPRLIEKFSEADDRVEISQKISVVRINYKDKRSKMFAKNLDDAVADDHILCFNEIRSNLSQLNEALGLPSTAKQ